MTRLSNHRRFYISESILIYAYQTIARGWRTQEPEPLEGKDEVGQRERARRFDRLCYRAPEVLRAQWK